jgi:peptidoglycan/xylan/chitin deacetylase (PgdA/CDA1 family)
MKSVFILGVILFFNKGHRAFTSLTTDEVVSEIEWTKRAIMEVVGYTPKYFRPPFGDMDDRIRAILEAMNLTPVIWNWDSRDFMLNNAPGSIPPGQLEQSAVDFINSPIRNAGVIGLQHDRTQAAAERGPTLGDELLKSNIQIVSLNQCLGVTSSGFADFENSWLSSITFGILSLFL